MMEYIRLNRGLTNYTLVPADDNVWDYIQDNQSDYYTSIFQYNQEQYDQWKRTGSVAGIKQVKTNKLVFDFDDKNNLEAAKSDALTLIGRLMSSGVKEDNVQVSFSGSKGFCVEVDTKNIFTQEEFKNVTFGLASDLQSFDRVVNDAQRIVRVVGTKHPVSGLYKIPLSVKQLSENPVTKIKNMAANIETVDQSVMLGWVPVDVPEAINVLKVAPQKKEIQTKVVSGNNDIDMTLRPKWLSEAKFALQQGHFEDGERNLACMILASTYKNQGFPKEITYRIIKGTLELRADRLGHDGYDKKELWKTIIEPVYGPHWQGGTYSYENTPLLKTVTERLGLKIPEKETNELSPITTVTDSFKKFATEIKINTIKLGIPKIDNEVRITTSMLVGLVSPPGGGKTTTSFEIMNHASRNNINTVFFSMDMGAPLVYQRLIQKHTGLHSQKIFDMYENDDKRVGEFEQTLAKEYKNVSFCFKSGLTVEEIKELTIKRQDQLGGRIKLVVVDYLECISSQFSDSTASSAYISQKLKDLANELECTVLLLLQPQKVAGDPSDEMTSYTKIKGSSAIQQACSVIFSMSRPGFSPKEPGKDRYVSFSVLKNRMGSLGQYDFHWNGLTGEIRELDDCEIEELKEVRESKAASKKADYGGI